MKDTMVQDRYCRTGAELAAELYEIAGRLDALGDLPLSPVYLILHVQAVQHAETPAKRTASIDILAGSLGLPPGAAEGTPNGTVLHVSSGMSGRVDVQAYTRAAE
jgi:hypothetical protein